MRVGVRKDAAGELLVEVGGLSGSQDRLLVPHGYLERVFIFKEELGVINDVFLS